MLQLSSARPYFATGNWKYASGETTRRSQIIERMTPAPIAGPLIAPMIGTGALSMARFNARALSGSSSATRAVGQVRARAEHCTLAGQHDGPDVFGGGLLDRFAQAVDELAVQRIAALRALHFQGHHVAVTGHTNHGATLLASSCEPDRRPAATRSRAGRRLVPQLGHAPAGRRHQRHLPARAGGRLDRHRPRRIRGDRQGTVFGRPVALVACEFDFLAGSIGVAAAERITVAVERATRRAFAAAGVAELRRHPHAGGHRRVPADGQDRGGRRTAQAGAPAVSGLPAPSHHRRGVRSAGARWATSPRQNPAHSSDSSARVSTSTFTASPSRRASRPRRTCSGTASSTAWFRSTRCAQRSTAR